MNLIPVILSNYGHFNLHPQLLFQLKVPINSYSIRIDQSLVLLYNFYGNQIAQNCSLRIENIPDDILKNKKVIINKDFFGRETLDVFEWDGDVVMKYW
jgi:hypothetical protein